MYKHKILKEKQNKMSSKIKIKQNDQEHLKKNQLKQAEIRNIITRIKTSIDGSSRSLA